MVSVAAEVSKIWTKKRPLDLLIRWGMSILLSIIPLELQEHEVDRSWLPNGWVARGSSQQVCAHAAEILKQEKEMRI